ncbi:5-carboxymethyl-2-hydroxymuconate Delta-isomerase [Azospirillum sp. TSO22-1]|uniref:5-carboxymethyl-2-hydroxymuconate Delta-isomerase n=1 Tax=Azospirillum sp. TSO22-1 TaxID=716789 RepID=UPI000D604358|nr:5-carboxymethyl-2-hydroxymuconate Delta-isomerase [Azospirillum sp. TSO22-1]PWC35173.1 5-carboxymethyl-2-hydroxymuconate isomerase [Azospirillum sp. TSO22-1]
MPHVIVEYTDNIATQARMPVLLATINRILIAQGGAFPTGGIRSRAVRLTDYCVADGTEDDAFVHITLKIGSGRSDEVKKTACDDLFAAVKEHFADLFSRRFLALSMELTEFSEGGTYKHNNIHARYRKA